MGGRERERKRKRECVEKRGSKIVRSSRMILGKVGVVFFLGGKRKLTIACNSKQVSFKRS